MLTWQRHLFRKTRTVVEGKHGLFGDSSAGIEFRQSLPGKHGFLSAGWTKYGGFALNSHRKTLGFGASRTHGERTCGGWLKQQSARQKAVTQRPSSISALAITGVPVCRKTMSNQ